MKNVINMCRSGGFNLTKFASNSKELLISIPEDKMRPGVKDSNLLGGFFFSTSNSTELGKLDKQGFVEHNELHL